MSYSDVSSRNIHKVSRKKIIMNHVGAPHLLVGNGGAERPERRERLLSQEHLLFLVELRPVVGLPPLTHFVVSLLPVVQAWDGLRDTLERKSLRYTSC